MVPAGGAAPETTPRGEEIFLRQVQPLLQTKCLGCHGENPKEIAGGLDLRSRATLLKGGDRGPALVPGEPVRSLLYQAVLRTGELAMPPKKTAALSAAETAALKAWIEAGAPWATPTPVAATTSAWDADSKERWAFAPVQSYPIPRISIEPAAVQTPIDAFVLHKLSEKGLKPVGPADRQTLIRRATWDLTGLPPTPQEIEAFVQDPSPDAFEKVVDRLLDSPHYAEQWARHWLDVVRYADTSGFSNDFERPNAWRYREYVVRSLHQDKPFNRFIVEQLAGDELDPKDPELLVAVGVLRMGPWEHTGMSVAAVTRQQFLDDVTHNTAAAFLGLTLRCARCHDHKFDPIPTKDYYRLQAVFAATQFADREAPFLPAENITGLAESKARSDRLLKETNERLAALVKKNRDAVAALLQERGLQRVDQLPAAERSTRIHLGLTPQEMTLQKIYQRRLQYYEREAQRYQPVAFSVYNGPLNNYLSNRALNRMPAQRTGPAPVVFLLKGGALESPGEQVTPGLLSGVVGSNEAVRPSAWNSIPDTVEGRRLALANWIASPQNPLTARVLVNRVWQHHFGNKGIVATPNNFGKMGKRPTHPELLDWLATWFVEHGWSLKKLHRLILTSAVYQRSSDPADLDRLRTVDPNNELLAFYPARRLAAEEIRDGLLAVSGELSRTMGGPGIHPEINQEMALQPRHVMGTVAPAYQPSPRPEQRHRRTLYAFRYRTLADPLLEVFNQPASDLSCERRDETTVTPQVFALFHGQFAHDRALALARRLETLAADSSTRLDLAFRWIYGRPVTASERQRCLEHVAQMLEHHRRHQPVVVELPTVVQRQMIEEFTGAVVKWEEELDILKRYQRDLKPWDVGPETRAWAELCLVLLNSNEFLYVR